MERVIEELSLGLVEMGHKVTLISYPGYRKLPGVNFINMLEKFSRHEADTRYLELIPDDADILHFHIPMGQDKLDLPYLMTFHGNLSEDQDKSELPKNTIFISRDHAQRHGGEEFIYHGYNPELIPFSSKSLRERDCFAFLGRGSLKRKGLHLAKKIAKKFKTPLHIGGKRGFSWMGTQYLGHLNNDQKYQLLGRSKALLFPILWEEPFGLVQIEAMFCGASVMALSRGSVPEVLGQESGDKMFFHHKTLEEILEIPETWENDIDPWDIRQYAEKNFSHRVMCENYCRAYREVLSKG